MKVCILDSDATLTNALSEGLGARDIVAEHRRPPSDGDLDAGTLSCDLIVLCQQDSSDSAAKLIRGAWPTPIAILLRTADTSNVMQAARLGAIDACDRNAPPDLIVEWIGEICARERKKRSERLSRGHYRSTSCPAMTALQRDVERVAQTDSTVLIAGETGTGKELAAREVHRLGKRADRSIVTVNCAAIPDTLIESELFGYEKGAFTGATSNRSGLIEAADGGTLFLDEIGELPLAAQARLLRYIQEGEIRRIGSVTSKKVDARLICATHRNLRMLADSGQFREDLFYRIDVLRLDIPALRERGADIVDMAEEKNPALTIAGEAADFGPQIVESKARRDRNNKAQQIEQGGQGVLFKPEVAGQYELPHQLRLQSVFDLLIELVVIGRRRLQERLGLQLRPFGPGLPP